MGTRHLVQTDLADWTMPTGQRIAPGHPIVERPTVPRSDHYDTVGDVAQMVNNLYERSKPPLIHDIFQTDWVSGSAGVWSTVAIYRIPSEMIGSGKTATADQEGVKLRAYAYDSGGAGSSTVELRVTIGGVTKNTNTTISGTPVLISTSANCNFNDAPLDPAGDVVVLVEGRSGASNRGRVQSVYLEWWTEDATLPDGPYASDFLPCATVTSKQYALEGEPLSTEKMRRLILDAIELKRRRTPGMVVGSFHLAGLTGTTRKTMLRGFAWQSAYVTAARVWVLCRRGSSQGRVYCNLGGVERELTPTATGAGLANATWRRFDLVISPHRFANPIGRELTIDAQDATIYSACGWYRTLRNL